MAQNDRFSDNNQNQGAAGSPLSPWMQARLQPRILPTASPLLSRQLSGSFENRRPAARGIGQGWLAPSVLARWRVISRAPSNLSLSTPITPVSPSFGDANWDKMELPLPNQHQSSRSKPSSASQRMDSSFWGKLESSSASLFSSPKVQPSRSADTPRLDLPSFLETPPPAVKKDTSTPKVSSKPPTVKRSVLFEGKSTDAGVVNPSPGVSTDRSRPSEASPVSGKSVSEVHSEPSAASGKTVTPPPATNQIPVINREVSPVSNRPGNPETLNKPVSQAPEFKTSTQPAVEFHHSSPERGTSRPLSIVNSPVVPASPSLPLSSTETGIAGRARDLPLNNQSGTEKPVSNISETPSLNMPLVHRKSEKASASGELSINHPRRERRSDKPLSMNRKASTVPERPREKIYTSSKTASGSAKPAQVNRKPVTSEKPAVVQRSIQPGSTGENRGTSVSNRSSHPVNQPAGQDAPLVKERRPLAPLELPLQRQIRSREPLIKPGTIEHPRPVMETSIGSPEVSNITRIQDSHSNPVSGIKSQSEVHNIQRSIEMPVERRAAPSAAAAEAPGSNISSLPSQVTTSVRKFSDSVSGSTHSGASIEFKHAEPRSNPGSEEIRTREEIISPSPVPEVSHITMPSQSPVSVEKADINVGSPTPPVIPHRSDSLGSGPNLVYRKAQPQEETVSRPAASAEVSNVKPVEGIAQPDRSTGSSSHPAVFKSMNKAEDSQPVSPVYSTRPAAGQVHRSLELPVKRNRKRDLPLSANRTIGSPGLSRSLGAAATGASLTSHISRKGVEAKSNSVISGGQSISNQEIQPLVRENGSQALDLPVQRSIQPGLPPVSGSSSTANLIASAESVTVQREAAPGYPPALDLPVTVSRQHQSNTGTESDVTVSRWVSGTPSYKTQSGNNDDPFQKPQKTVIGNHNTSPEQPQPGTNTTQEAPKPDLKVLARDLYPYLKRMIIVDKERLSP